MKDKINQLKGEFSEAVKAVQKPEELAELENKFLGRKAGLLTNIMKGLKELPKEEIAEIGAFANEFKISFNYCWRGHSFILDFLGSGFK